VNQRGYPRGCALMRAQNLMRILDESLADLGIAQKLSDRAFERTGIVNLDRGLL
jgi:hypothetical protein